MFRITRLRLQARYGAQANEQCEDLERRFYEMQDLMCKPEGLWCKLLGVERDVQQCMLVVHHQEPRSLRDLQASLARMPESSRDINIGLIAREILRGLAYLESQGLCHRNLSLEAIRLSDSNSLRIQGMGLFYLTRGGLALGSKGDIGDPLYLPPEILRDGPRGAQTEKEAFIQSASADIWALGVILVQLLRGAPRAFGGPADRKEKGDTSQGEELPFVLNFARKPNKASLKKIEALFVDADESPDALHPRKVLRGLVRLAEATTLVAGRSPGGEGVQEWLDIGGVRGDESLKDLISRCLELDPSKRPTAEELLSHPFLDQDWFGKYDETSEASKSGVFLIKPRGKWKRRVRLVCSTLKPPEILQKTFEEEKEKEIDSKDDLSEQIEIGEEIPPISSEDLWYLLCVQLSSTGQSLGEWLLKRDRKSIDSIVSAVHSLPVGLLGGDPFPIWRDGGIGPCGRAAPHGHSAIESRDLDVGDIVEMSSRLTAPRRSGENLRRESPILAARGDPNRDVRSVVGVAAAALRELYKALRYACLGVSEVRRIVRVLIDNAIPLPSHLRPQVWRSVMGVHYDTETKFRIQSLESRLAPNLEIKEVLSQFHQQVALDIPRCHSYSPRLMRSSVKTRIIAILRAWASGLTPDTVEFSETSAEISISDTRRYWQGFDSVAATVALQYTSASTAWAVLEKISDRYLKNYLVEKSSCLLAHVALVSELLAFWHPELCLKMKSLQINPDMYAVSWLLTLFTHSLPIDSYPFHSTVFALLDTMLCEDPSVPLPLFAVVSLLLLNAPKILRLDVNSILAFLSSFPPTDVIALARLSSTLARLTPCALYDWALSPPFKEPTLAAWKEQRAELKAVTVATASSAPISPAKDTKDSKMQQTSATPPPPQKKNTKKTSKSKTSDELVSLSISAENLLKSLDKKDGLKTGNISKSLDKKRLRSLDKEETFHARLVSLLKSPLPASLRIPMKKDAKKTTVGALLKEKQFPCPPSWEDFLKASDKMKASRMPEPIILDVRQNRDPPLPGALHFPLEIKRRSRAVANNTLRMPANLMQKRHSTPLPTTGLLPVPEDLKKKRESLPNLSLPSSSNGNQSQILITGGSNNPDLLLRNASSTATEDKIARSRDEFSLTSTVSSTLGKATSLIASPLALIVAAKPGTNGNPWPYAPSTFEKMATAIANERNRLGGPVFRLEICGDDVDTEVKNKNNSLVRAIEIPRWVVVVGIHQAQAQRVAKRLIYRGVKCVAIVRGEGFRDYSSSDLTMQREESTIERKRRAE